MAGMRVSQLAKELGVSSEELLAKLNNELNIPVRRHATPLSEELVAAGRAAYEPAEDATNKAQAKKEAAAQAKQQAERRAAVEAERAAREEERLRREGGVRRAASTTSSPATTTKEDAASTKDAPVRKRYSATEPSAYAALAENIAESNARAKAIAEEAEARARAERTAQEVARKQQVEEELRQRKGSATAAATPAASSAQVADTAATQPSPTPAPAQVSQSSTRYNSLLAQIESENQRMAAAREEKTPAKSERQQSKGGTKTKEQKAAEGQGKGQSKAQSQDSGKASASRKGSKGEGAIRGMGLEVSDVAEQARASAASAQDKSTHRGKTGQGRSRDTSRKESKFEGGEDRYAQMAAAAEKIQKDKVLADARAAVAAATVEDEGRRKKRKEKREAENREHLAQQAIERGIDPELVLDSSVVQIPQGASVAKFSELIGVQPNEVIKRLFMMGEMYTLTQSMSDELIELIAEDMGRRVRVVSPEEEFAVVYHDTEEDLKPRPPVVTVMGHVDHGKTSLLDAIRHTGVTATEAGGITQHIGASVVNINDRQITFIDTPGHEAFTAMRARGAQVTDVIVLVVAADDGVMPQTIEAINHAKAADVPIVVAINKIDRDGANPDKVRQELVEYGVISEEWGGQNMFVEVSAKKHLHIDDLLETILQQADVLELKANPNAPASGFVIEANLDKGRGPVAPVVVQRGTLHPGDTVVAGPSWGRVRALVNPRGEHVQAAGPSDPVEILGLSSVPAAGDEFRVFEDERDARKLAEERSLRARLKEQESRAHMSLDDLFSRIEEGKQTDLNLIVKADVQGSIEALRDAFGKMDHSEVRINVVHSAVGGITETDVTLAAASDAIIIGFNVRPTAKSKQQAEKEGVDIRLYRVIYQAIDEINAARVGLLKPEIVEEDTGIAEVRETFKVPKVGTIAGCYIVDGEISRDDKIRVVREGTVIFEGTIASLRRFKDDVKSVRQGYECGIGVNGFQDLKVGDTIEGYVVKEVERTE